MDHRVIDWRHFRTFQALTEYDVGLIVRGVLLQMLHSLFVKLGLFLQTMTTVVMLERKFKGLFWRR
jgi:hypothetical protein